MCVTKTGDLSAKPSAPTTPRCNTNRSTRCRGMRAIIQNLGTIREASLDLRRLTVFVGPNNSGKTWTAYALAAIFSHYGWGLFNDVYEFDENLEIYPPLEQAVQNLIT